MAIVLVTVVSQLLLVAIVLLLVAVVLLWPLCW